MANLQSPQAPAYAAIATALVIAEPDAGQAAESLALAGICVRAQVDFARAADELGRAGQDLILIEAATAPPELLEATLARADATARVQHTSILVATTLDQLDFVIATMFGLRRHILCDPTMPERLSTLAIARAAIVGPAALHDATREAEYGRLQRLNEEVARIADTLARLTRGEEGDRRGGLRDPGSQYRGPDEEITAEASAHEIRAVIRSRRLRAQFFTPDLFADPAWDMLLDLFAAGLERRRVSVSSLCIAASVPPTTALRWIGTLHDAGLFERQADPSDRRRAYIGLSAKGIAGMRNYVSAAKRAGLNLV